MYAGGNEPPSDVNFKEAGVHTLQEIRASRVEEVPSNNQGSIAATTATPAGYYMASGQPIDPNQPPGVVYQGAPPSPYQTGGASVASGPYPPSVPFGGSVQTGGSGGYPQGGYAMSTATPYSHKTGGTSASDDAASRKKRKKFYMIIAVVALLIIGGVAIGAAVALSGSDDDDDGGDGSRDIELPDDSSTQAPTASPVVVVVPESTPAPVTPGPTAEPSQAPTPQPTLFPTPASGTSIQSFLNTNRWYRINNAPNSLGMGSAGTAFTSTFPSSTFGLWEEEGNPGPFRFTSSDPVALRITDMEISGQQIAIYDKFQEVSETTVPETPGICGNDPEACVQNANVSSLVYLFEPGSHALEFFLTSSETISRNAAFRLDTISYDVTRLVPSDIAVADVFGKASIDGDVIVATGYGEDSSPFLNHGAAYVFERSGGTWSQTAKFLPDDYTSVQFWGSINGPPSLSGNRVAIPHEIENDEIGSVYIFDRQAGTTNWPQTAKLTPPTGAAAGDRFGNTVSLDGNILAVGSQQGRAYIYEFIGGSWSLQRTVTKTFTSSSYPTRVAVSGTTVVVGLPYESVLNGRVEVYTQSGTTWSSPVTLNPDTFTELLLFGWDVDIDGDNIVVGCPFETGRAVSSGTAYVFSRSGTAWNQVAKVSATGGQTNDFFGAAVAIDGNRIVVGNQRTGDGPLTVFTQQGNTWVQTNSLGEELNGINDLFGWSVGVSGSTVIASAHGEDDDGESAGGLYVFEV